MPCWIKLETRLDDKQALIAALLEMGMKENTHYRLRQEGKEWVASLLVPDQWNFESLRTQGLIKQKATAWRTAKTAKAMGYSVSSTKDKTGNIQMIMRRY